MTEPPGRGRCSRQSVRVSPRARLAPDGARRRPACTAIVEAVLDALTEDGYARLTTAGVARRAGVSTATIYRRWTSKRELILATAAQLAAIGTDDTDTGSLPGDIRALLRDKQRIFSSRAGRALLILSGEAVHDPELDALLRTSVVEPARQHLRAAFDRADARGESRPVLDDDTATKIVLGAVLAGIAYTSSR